MGFEKNKFIQVTMCVLLLSCFSVLISFILSWKDIHNIHRKWYSIFLIVVICNSSVLGDYGLFSITSIL